MNHASHQARVKALVVLIPAPGERLRHMLPETPHHHFYRWDLRLTPRNRNSDILEDVPVKIVITVIPGKVRECLEGCGRVV
jgi:hypothetical protein